MIPLVVLIVGVLSLVGSGAVLMFSHTAQGSIEALIWLLLSLLLLLGALRGLAAGARR